MTKLPMKVLVAGANGHTGTLIVQVLQEKRYHPVAMLRDDAQVRKFESSGVATVLADLENEASLYEAVKGINAIIFAAGSGSKTGPEKTTDVDQNGAIRLIDVAQSAGIQRFVMLSSMGADPNSDSDRIQHYLRAKGVADEYLRNSQLSFTSVRPGRLTFEKGTSKIALAEKLHHSGTIPREDVARVIVASLAIPKTIGKTFDILSGEIPVEQALENL